MKEENPGNIKAELTIALTIVLLALCVACHESPKAQTTSDTLVFEGTLEKLGPDLGINSGVMAVYRLVKYRVEKVCTGEYGEAEIVVDHAIFSGEELQAIKINDRVCVSVKRSPKIVARYNAEGIRNPTDDVKTFYIAEEGPKLSDGKCCGDQR